MTAATFEFEDDKMPQRYNFLQQHETALDLRKGSDKKRVHTRALMILRAKGI